MSTRGAAGQGPEEQDAGGPGARFLERIGAEVRRRRRGAELTVQALAERAGISRRMLTLIEQGAANPSLVTVDKIARALGTDFAALTAPRDDAPVQVSADPVEVWRGPEGGRALLHIAAAGSGGPELWEWTLLPGERYDARPDPPGSQELILVTSGTLELRTADGTAELPAGASARLSSDRDYAYAPAGETPAAFVRVVHLGPRPG
ncbi:helix-turn-helix domain-containing protein [Nocardiopsis potens]|uniref:helix-turn-helix domain-containing protein n=1 Tax=Nocardiopsis potens TaxID=1246458 RepID=UPI0003497E81|nr:XRE family transcriptional regulator [Nocardiopsis potens]